MSVSYEYYKIFYYVGKYKSFNKAANVLMNSQPNITRAMNNLEAELDCKLFVRSHKGVTLTEEGQALYQYVEAAHRQLELGEAVIDSAKRLQNGHISIGFSVGINESLLDDIILPTLHTYHQQYPQVHLQITNESTPKLVSEITEGLLDLAVVTTLTGQHKTLHITTLRSFQDILIAGPSYKKLQNKKISLKQLIEYPIINLWHGTETYEFYNSFFASHGLLFEPSVETATTGQVLSFIASDMGLGFISPEYAKKALDEKHVFQIPLRETLPTRNILLIRNGGRPINAAAASLEEMLLNP